jgi:hypothetical protein
VHAVAAAVVVEVVEVVEVADMTAAPPGAEKKNWHPR